MKSFQVNKRQQWNTQKWSKKNETKRKQLSLNSNDKVQFSILVIRIFLHCQEKWEENCTLELWHTHTFTIWNVFVHKSVKTKMITSIRWFFERIPLTSQNFRGKKSNYQCDFKLWNLHFCAKYLRIIEVANDGNDFKSGKFSNEVKKKSVKSVFINKRWNINVDWRIQCMQKNDFVATGFLCG